MRSVAGWLFTLAVFGTLLMPIVLPAAAATAPSGRRGRRLLVTAGMWVAVCALAGVARLSGEDATAAERRDILLLAAATCAASAALLTFHLRRVHRMVTPALVVVSGALLLAVATGWSGGPLRLVTLALIAAAAAAGAALAASSRAGVATMLALVGAAFVPALVLLTEGIALGVH